MQNIFLAGRKRFSVVVIKLRLITFAFIHVALVMDLAMYSKSLLVLKRNAGLVNFHKLKKAVTFS